MKSGWVGGQKQRGGQHGEEVGNEERKQRVGGGDARIKDAAEKVLL